MNKENFIRILRNPQKVTEADLDQLESIVDQYPYFQTARSAIASASRAVNHNEAPKKLTTAAIYTTNRNLLKKYVSGDFDFGIVENIQVGIHRETLNLEKYVDEEQPIQERKGGKFKFVKKKEEDHENIGSGKFKDLTKVEEEYDYDQDDEEIVVETETKNFKTTVKPQQADEAPISDVPDKQKPKDEEVSTPPPPNAQSEEKASTKLVSRDEPVSIHEGPEHMLSVEKLVAEVYQNLDQYKKSRAHYFEVEKKLSELEEEQAVDDAIKKASSRMKATKEKTAAPKKKVAKKDDDEATTASKKKIASSKAETSKKKPPKAPAKTKSASAKSSNTDNAASEPANEGISKKISQQQKIIENFIKSNPKIVPDDNSKGAKVEDLSTRSGELHDDLLTENLAQILAKQGKTEKAIDIYQKLILKNPQKKSYFASRISELK